jgi:uncharacterized protein (TIGR03032 family)
LFTDFLKTAIPHKVSESSEFEGIEDTLLISVPNAPEDGLVMLENGKLFCFSLSGCTGLYRHGNQLFVSIVAADCMKLRVYEPGKQTKTILSSKLGDIHDVLILDDQLHVVSTGTNEVAVVDMTGKVRTSWKMHGFGDSCHINCLDVWDGRLVATAFGKFSTYRGYKGKTAGNGIILDVKTQETISNGFSAPHTPRRDKNGAIFVCDSRAKGISYQYQEERKTIAFPGSFPRGMSITDDKIYVGLSSLRHGGDKADPCIASAQVAVVDKKTFAVLKNVSLPQAEIYDVLVLRN